MIAKKSPYTLVKGLLRKGTKTAPILVKKGRERFIFKVFGRGAAFSHPEAKRLYKQMNEYHETLKSTGLSVSNIITVLPIQETIEGRRTGRWILGSKEQIIGKGKDVLHTITNCNETKARNLFGQMLEQTNLVTSHESAPNKPVKVLMDSVPKNWVEGKDGRLVYVDFFVPKFLDKQGRLTPFFKSLHTRGKSQMQFRYKNKGGIYAVLLTYTVAERPAMRAFFERTLLDFLKKHGETDAAKLVEDTIAKNYRVNFINQKITNKISLPLAQ